jgi:hypothetical protein
MKRFAFRDASVSLSLILLLWGVVVVAAVTSQEAAQGKNSNNVNANDIPEFMATPTVTPMNAAPHSCVAGKIVPLWKGMQFLWTNNQEIMVALKDIFHFGDLIPLLLLGWVMVPMVDIMYQKAYQLELLSLRKIDQEGEGPTPFRPEFHRPKLFFVLQSLRGIARIGLLVYLVDLSGMIASEVSGLQRLTDLWQNHGLSQSVATVLYTMWVADRFKKAKRYFVFQRIARGPSADEGKAELVNHMLNFVVYGIALIVLAQMLSLKMGVALSSFFAFGGSATLILSLASQDIVKQLLSGLALTVGNEYHHGEEVILENGQGGFIQQIGWTHTLFRSKLSAMLLYAT